LIDGRREIHLGNLDPTRDLTFVHDTVDGFITAMRYDGLWGDPVNLGTGREVTIGDLARTIIEISGVDAAIVSDSSRIRPDKSEVERLLSDPTKMREATGWTARTSLEAGLAATYEWIAENRHWYGSAEQYHV
jgi:nucleoside-diphosphate-sugar epimerase